ncbi:MAG: hypothetical protein RLZZ135_1604 [Cyanobacteriota bacterium]
MGIFIHLSLQLHTITVLCPNRLGGCYSIVIPTLTHLRSVLASEITARAEQKCPGSVEAQKKYAKDYQMTISRWSYNRLIETIRSKAQQLGIAVESGFQLARASPQEQAKDIVIATYHSRSSA